MESVPPGGSFMGAGVPTVAMRDDHELPRESVRPDPETTDAAMRCRACGATFLRREAATPEKGQVVCPECGSADIAALDSCVG